MNELLEKLISVEQEISQKQPVVGFHHRFYVPGWIGFIQECIVEHNMGKFVDDVFYDKMNYLEFGNWIATSSKKICELLLIEAEQKNYKDSELFQQQANAIIELFNTLTLSWCRCAPEVVSTYTVGKADDDYITSLAGFVYRELENNLKPLGYPQSIEKEPTFYEGPSFRDVGNQLLSYFCNLLLIGIIFFIGSLIFG